MERLIKEMTELVFELKGDVPDGTYVKLMDNLKELYKLTELNLDRRVSVARSVPGILDAWIHNKKGATYSGSLSTNDGLLFSYSALIGCTNLDGAKQIINLTASGHNYVSHTTSTHVNKAIKFCTDNNHNYEIIASDNL